MKGQEPFLLDKTLLLMRGKKFGERGYLAPPMMWLLYMEDIIGVTFDR